MKNDRKTGILHLISGDLWAGAEVQAMTLISWLNREPDLRISSIIFNEGRLSRELMELRIPVHVFDEKKHNAFQLFLKVINVVSTEKIQILHTHRYKENVIGGVASLFSGRPYLVRTVHGMAEPFRGIKKMKASLYGSLDRWITKILYDRIIAVSSDLREKLKRELHPSSIVQIHNCVDIEKINASRSKVDIRKELQIDSNAVIIGSAGRLVPVKGLNYLLEAAQMMQKKIDNLRILIVGDGPESERLKGLARSLRLEPHVIFTGHRDDVLSLISSMNLFLLPSLSEGIPIVLLEALALGVPVVASNVGGIPEILEDGQTGVLVPPGNGKVLAEACLHLLENNEKARLLANNAKRSVESNFSAEVMAREVAQIYRSLTS